MTQKNRPIPHGKRRGAAAAVSGPAAAPVGLALRAVDIRTSIRPTVAEVDLAALARNVGHLRALMGSRVAIYGVVKADAYGHGAVAVGQVLAPLCDALAVSLVEEGLELRSAGIVTPILVLGAYYDRFQSEVLEQGLTPVVYDRGDLERFGAAPVRRRRAEGVPHRNQVHGSGLVRPGSKAGRDRTLPPVAIHVKVDTGMGRLGVPVSELPEFFSQVQRFPRVRVEGICTHFASADMPDPTSTTSQLNRFQKALSAARPKAPHLQIIHAANSAAAVRFSQARFDAVRPGLALYGAMPSAVVAQPHLEPVLSLRTRIMALHDLKTGATVSYGGQWRAGRPCRIATLPIGYADGYPRHVRGAQALLGGHRVPVVGAVCMDMMMVDVTDVPRAGVGDMITLIGGPSPLHADGSVGASAITLDELAGWAGTVNYEILCGLSKRVPRIYKGAEIAPLREPGRAHPPVGRGVSRR